TFLHLCLHTSPAAPSSTIVHLRVEHLWPAPSAPPPVPLPLLSAKPPLPRALLPQTSASVQRPVAAPPHPQRLPLPLPRQPPATAIPGVAAHYPIPSPSSRPRSRGKLLQLRSVQGPPAGGYSSRARRGSCRMGKEMTGGRLRAWQFDGWGIPTSMLYMRDPDLNMGHGWI
ncbi:hypothetical protein BRADI_2g43705v3, partial [Brachypodium distachyon]